MACVECGTSERTEEARVWEVGRIEQLTERKGLPGGVTTYMPTVWHVRKGDVIVLKLHRDIPAKDADRIKAEVKAMLREAGIEDAPVMVLGPDIDLVVLDASEIARP